jgi:hypothetical protein
MKIKQLNIIILLTFSLCFVHNVEAQNCVPNFVNDVLNTSQVKNEKFNNKVKTTVKSYSNVDFFSLDSARVIKIPVVFSTKKGTEISGKGNLSKDELLCYIDGKSMVFDEALIYSDTEILGAVIQDPRSKSLLRYENDSVRINFIRPLINEVKRINPDIIFSIYNIPRCYWYIKDNELFVLSYEQNNSEMEGFMTHKAKSFIEEHLKEEELCFLSHKRIIVIGGK